VSLSLHYAIVPVEPTVLGGFDALEQLILDALNLGDPFDQTTAASLLAAPLVIEKGDPVATYLRGALAAIPSWPDFLPTDQAPPELRGWHAMHRELTTFLAELDERGELLIGAS